jgi:outer membrane lipoprotein-sorting protein
VIRPALLARGARVRLLAPAAAVVAILVAAWIPTVTAGATTPNLPALSAEQVIAKAAAANVTRFSGSVRWTANLGIPDLSSLASSAGSGLGSSPNLSLTSLLSGSHTVKVWVDGPDRQRLALPGALSEIDFVHNGERAWYYDSTTDTVTDYVLGSGTGSNQATGRAHSDETSLTPDEMAERLLSHLSPTTQVTVASPMYVAGRPAYQLLLAPAPGTKDAAASTIGQIAIAVDAATGMPLRVAVLAKGQSAPALEIGFTSVSFSTPSAREFRPLSGSTVRTQTLRGSGPVGLLGAGLRSLDPPGLVGSGWGAVVRLDGARLNRTLWRLLDGSTPVSGAFGSGFLVQTPLLNALFLPNGTLLAGFVTPSALEAVAASSSR